MVLLSVRLFREHEDGAGNAPVRASVLFGAQELYALVGRRADNEAKVHVSRSSHRMDTNPWRNESAWQMP